MGAFSIVVMRALGFSTLTVRVSSKLSPVPHTVARPSATALTMPSLLTLATWLSLLAQLMIEGSTMSLPSPLTPSTLIS